MRPLRHHGVAWLTLLVGQMGCLHNRGPSMLCLRRVMVRCFAVALTLVLFAGSARATDATDANFVPIAGFEQRQTAEETYEANALGIVRTDVTTGSWPFTSTHTSFRVVRGNYRIAVAAPAFLRAIGRPDEAERYVGAEHWATGLWWTGMSTFAIGCGTLLFLGVRAHSTNLMIAAAAVGGGGLLLAEIGGSGPRLQFTEPEFIDFVENYNGWLAGRLGIPRPTPPRSQNWSILPYAAAKSAGITTFWRF